MATGTAAALTAIDGTAPPATVARLHPIPRPSARETIIAGAGGGPLAPALSLYGARGRIPRTDVILQSGDGVGGGGGGGVTAPLHRYKCHRRHGKHINAAPDGPAADRR